MTHFKPVKPTGLSLLSFCDLTEPPSTHIVELCAEQQRGQNVDHRENNPEGCVVSPKYLRGKKKHSTMIIKKSVFLDHKA